MEIIFSRAYKYNKSIKYLGVSFNGTIMVNENKIVTDLKQKTEAIISTPFLKQEQKLQVLNSFVRPTLNYHFQNIPTEKFKKSFLQDLDHIFKLATKQILDIPSDTPDAMLYADPRVKGIGAFKPSWEAQIQCHNIKKVINKTNHPIVRFDVDVETHILKTNLELTETAINSKSKPYEIRNELKKKMFTRWSSLPTKGKGVSLYSQYPPANISIKNRQGLTDSEMRTYLQMVADNLPLRGTHGRSRDGYNCRHCNGAFESQGHVLGNCDKGNDLRQARHSAVRSTIANGLRKKGWTVHEEVQGIEDNGLARRIDIIAIDPKTKKGHILDPTIRLESSATQPQDVHEEKSSIYTPTIAYYKEKYGLLDIDVEGLFIGARGTISEHFLKFLRKFDLERSIAREIAVTAVKYSIQIVRNHLYSSN